MCHDVPSVIPERFVIASEPLAVGFELFRMSSPYRSDVPFVSDDGFPFFRNYLPWVGEVYLMVESCLAEIADIAVLRQKFVSGTISASLIPTKKIT